MKWTDLIIFALGSALTLFVQLLTYNNLTKNKAKISYKMLLCSLIGGILVTYNAYTNVNALRAYISFGILLILEILIFNDSITKTLIYGIFSYVLAIFTEIFFDIILVITKIIDMKTLDEHIFTRVAISILIILPAFFITKNSRIQSRVNKITDSLGKSVTFLYIAIITLTATLVIAFKNISNLTYTNYISNVILLIIFAVFLIIVIYNEQKVEKEISKTEALLDFMADYERKIEEDRINRHEMLNNLLILKSYSNKNSKKFNETLDELINTYSKKGIDIKNIYKLPSGLKGIIYYKVSEVKSKNLNININISKQLSSSLSNLDSNTYTLVCRIVGITFDNAIEASENSNEKIVNFDVYEENNNIVIELSNSYKNKIDLGKINNKNYSTKGKNRGLGLYIVKTLIKNNNNIILEQNKVDKFFITKIYIKNLDKE